MNVNRNHSFSTLSEEKLLSTIRRDIVHFTKTLEWVAFLTVISSVRMSMPSQRFILVRELLSTLTRRMPNITIAYCSILNLGEGADQIV